MASEATRTALFDRLFTALVVEQSRCPDFINTALGVERTRAVRAQRIKMCFDVATQAVDVAYPPPPAQEDLRAAATSLVAYCNEQPKSGRLQSLLTTLELALHRSRP